MIARCPRPLVVLATAVAALAFVAPSAGEPSGAAANGIAYSTASNRVIQAQPAAHACHARGRGLYSFPDPRCTPGALNPAVTQVTIHETVCRSGWSESVRPPESVTEPEKYASMASYGDTGSAAGYEYDHLVPLELGGATNDPRNLWPERGGSPNPKDEVEDYLNREVCEGRMRLARAQRLIVTNWVAIYRKITRSKSTAPTAPTSPSQPAYCTASARWNGRYQDWDVYIQSDQYDRNATVTGNGTSASYHSNGSGYADVYFDAAESAAGERITVTVGRATCHSTL